MDRVIRIGTRGSLLALTQTGQVADALVELGVFSEFELVIIKTSGDRIQDRSLAEIGGKGLFIKEIEEAMLEGQVDLAVHSMKDLPGEVAPGLVLEGMLPRQIPNDILITHDGCASIADLPQGACLGTSSLRRQSQAMAQRPDLKVIPLRGNVDTRLNKLWNREGGLDAIILAAAGMARLGRELDEAVLIPIDDMLPAIAQGTLGLEVREEDTELRERLRAVQDEDTLAVTRAERSLLRALSGSCRIPLAGYATLNADREVTLTGILTSPDGTQFVRSELTADITEVTRLGERVAAELLAGGGSQILNDLGIVIGEASTH